ncbi:MAG: hypothetical protein H0X69_04280 [Gemmatimonadales bacterium]|nr:hypothetical protein [Gemmatimonadales bacterium]
MVFAITLTLPVEAWRRGEPAGPRLETTAPSIFGHGPVFRDFNFAQDQEAALGLLGMRLPLTLLPYEAAREIALTSRDLDRMAAAGGAAGWVAARSRRWLGYWEGDIGRDGFYPFDLVAAGYVARPEVARCAKVLAWVGPDAGVLGWLGRRGLFVRSWAEGPATGETAVPAQYCLDLTEPAGDWFVARLTAQDRPRPGPLNQKGPQGVL